MTRKKTTTEPSQGDLFDPAAMAEAMEKRATGTITRLPESEPAVDPGRPEPDPAAQDDASMIPVDKRRVEQAVSMLEEGLSHQDRWYIHSVLAQCFLPYRNPKSDDWVRTSGDYGIAIQGGIVSDPGSVEGARKAGVPFGAKPRLINCYVQTHALKYRTPVVPIESSMSAFMRALGFKVTGGKTGTITLFRDQATRLAASNWTIWGANPKKGGIEHVKVSPYSKMNLWFPTDPDQHTLWPSEVELTREFYEHLKDHAIPYDFRALGLVRESARAQDVYLWMTQRLYRIPKNQPLILGPRQLFQHFGGGMKSVDSFHSHFKRALRLACLAYPDANVESLGRGRYSFKRSKPPIPKVSLLIGKPTES